MKKSLFLTCFVMLCSLVFGQNHWTVNDALYENNMSVFANVTIGNETAINAEIAAFYDDEVRGVAMTDQNGDVALSIHGSNREQISFKLFYNGKEYASNATIDFEVNGIVETTIDFYEVHWIYEPNYDLNESMTIVGKIYIDGVPQTGDNFEVAAFYNDSLRGVAKPQNGFVYLYILGHGKETSPFEFKLYDGRRERELVSDLRDVNVQFSTDTIIGTKENPLWMNFITTPYVAQIGEVRYQSLANAFAAAQDGDEIIMIDNVTEVVNITKIEAVTLDMAGFTLTGSILAPNAKLTVENGNIINNDKAVSAIEINVGELALNNVNISSERHAVRIDGAVTATIDGGTYKVLGSNKGTYHTVNVSDAANVTILNGTFDGPKGTSADSGSAVNVQSGAKVTIEGGDFSGGKNATLGVSGKMELTGGTYDQDVQKYCVYGYMSLKGNDGKYTVVEAAARIGETYYKTFDEAYTAANKGDVIELLQTAVITNSKTWINYSKKQITVKANLGTTAFRVQDGAYVWFGGMTIESDDYCITVGAADGTSGANVQIHGGTYNGETSAISVTKGDVQILDGTFKVEPYKGSYEYTINCVDANYKNGTADVSIQGGKFYNFNPQNNAAEGAGTDFLTGDYTAVQDAEGWYSVGKGVARVVTAGKDKSYATLLDAIKAVKEGEHIELLSNITLDYNARDSYETQTQNIVIDGKGYVLTLNQKNSDWASIGLANGSKLVLSNMTIEKTGYGDTSGAWNTHAIIFSCPLEMNDVTVNNGIAVQAGATLNGVTINEANGYYGLWINGNGQEVTVNDGAINATNGGRGIKIADQYIDAPAQVTLNVDGTVFNTAKKAAVLVTSTAGAEITATNVDITNVASDNTNFAWVDEARANYFGNVTLNNGNAYVEGGEESYEVSAKTDGVFGYYKKLETALAADNTSDITILRPITIANGETRVLDLNGKTVTGTDNGTASYGLFTNKGNLTINDTKGNGKITLTATNNRGWNAYSSVISNTVGGKLTVNGGTIEHSGGTDMAYGIDNLTNGKGTYAETVVNGGTVKSTYRAIRQFLNGIEAQNILTVNGGTIEGANKSIWMQDPSAKANTGKLTVAEEAVLNGDVYLFVTAGSTEWPVEVAIANAALSEDSELLTGNVPATYSVEQVDGIWGVYAAVASVNGVGYTTVTKAINAANDGETVQLHALTIDEAIAPWAGDSQHRLEKSITIVGAKDANGNLATTLTGGLFLGYNDGTVRDNTITVEDINFVGKGVTVANQKNVVIEGNKFTDINALVSEQHGNSGSAIHIIGTNNDKSIVATVENNVIENVTGTKQAGIYMSQVANATVKGNTVTGTTHNAITISAATDATILVENNTLSQWGLSGEGRAMRISGGATVNVNENVMSNTAAPEEFVKITGATTVDASKNYWNGNTPLAEKMFLTDLTIDPVTILDSYYTDAEKTNLVKLAQSVAMIDTKYYQSFASAIAAVQNNETIELLKDCAENVTIEQKTGLRFTIYGNGKTYTGTINVDGNNRGTGLTGAGLTITKVNFKNEVNTPISITTTEYACNITVDGCKFTGKEGVTTYGIKLSHALNITVKNVEATDVFDLVYSNKVVTGFTAENVKATNVEYGFFMSYGKKLSFKNVEVNATMSGVGLNNYNASQATFENCKFTAKWPVYFMAPNSTNKYSLVFNGTENAFTSNVEGEEWLYVEKTSAVITATYNDEELVGVSSMPAKIGKVHYNTLQHAINAVENEGTVTLASDFVLGDDDIILAETENYKTMAHVQGKNITLDMNGKTIDVTYTGGNYLMAVVLVADGAGLTINGNGTINAVGQNADGTAAKNIAYMIWKRGETGYLNIVNGTFHLNTAADSIIYTNGDEIVTVNGGTFILDAVASQTNGFPVIFSTTGNNEKQIVVNAGTFNYDINHQIRPFEVYVSEDKALKKSQIDGRDMWTIVPAEAYVTELLGEWVNASGDREHKVGYATLAEAVAAVNNLGKDVTLLKDVTIDELIKIEKEATLDLNGNKVTSTAKKAFEVYANATIKNGTIEAANRAVDTRTAVELTLTNVTLVADKYYSAYGNPQPLTIGGSENGTKVNMTNVNISAEAGYGIITFVETELTATNSTIGGYNALYVKPGSDNSTFNFVNSTLSGSTASNDVEGNSFSTIAVRANNVTVNVDADSEVNAEGDYCYALSLGGNFAGETSVEDAKITIAGTINVTDNNILASMEGKDNVVKVDEDYADELNAAGYATSEPEDGLVTVLGQAVAKVGETLYATLQDAVNAADGKTVEVLAKIAQSGTTVVTGTVTIDLNGFTVAYTSANPGEDMITVKGGTLVINDSESDGKITYVNTDATAGNVTVSTISVEPNSTLIVNGGTIENKTVKADGSSIYPFAIDLLTNGTLGDVNVTINGGTVYSDYMAIRQFNNGTACKNTLVVTDGYIYGAKRAIQIHMDNNAAYTTISGGKVEGGNYSLCFLTTSENLSVSGGEFIGDVWFSGTNGFITGGTFDTDVNDYCHVDYSAIPQANNTWVVERTSGTLTTTLEEGWNWFSSYIDIEGAPGLDSLTDALGSYAEQVKEGVSGQGKFLQYSTTSGWYGNLTATSSKKMYQIKTTADVEVNIYGEFFGVENYKPILRTGWNYLSYPHTDTLSVELALQGFTPVNGDLIKTLEESSSYRNGKWVGQLKSLNPGEGYMYKSAGEDKEVLYTTTATRSTAKAYVSETPEYWTLGASQYPNNMTMIATLDVEGGDYEVAAFVDGELRGSARPIYVEDLDQYIMVMTILGEEVADITFKYYDFNTEEEYDLNNVIVYSDNAVLGSLEEPYTLTRGTTGIGEATLSDINIYPNPTTTDREINLQATCDKVEVFNTLGVKVAEYENVDTIDALETAGTYVIRLTLNGDVKHCRLVVK